MVDVKQATQYAAEDADITLLICDGPTIDEAGLRNIHDQMELPLSIILARRDFDRYVGPQNSGHRIR